MEKATENKPKTDVSILNQLCQLLFLEFLVNFCPPRPSGPESLFKYDFLLFQHEI